ncbi:hypothetical protein GTW38_31370 [Streptomyces sp. SID7804]|nr:hypothetical protein [Streptomyces sp. SID7804]MYS31337.1 hypothetical protein [Streptomyces sp. SID7804]
MHSEVTGRVAADRTVRRTESGRSTGPLDKWRKPRDAIHADVCCPRRPA